ncbi:MAG: hypothetical protein MK160_15860 [Rhodobacteraceae bacterium]|nr:hypothetical protein [Paracoccaceae bacterium]
MKKLVFATSLVVLAACQTTVETDSGGGATFTSASGDLNGTYNPADTTAEQIKEQVRQQCESGNFKHYVEGPGEAGMMVYTARCL